MDLKLELLSRFISDAVHDAIEFIHIDTEEAIYAECFLMLSEIKDVICDLDMEDDFDVVEAIVEIFEKYKVDAGGRHDFS